MRRKWIVLCSIFVLMTLAAVSATAQTVPANWKKFDGKFFSFSYPPDWKLTQYSDSYVGLQSMQASSLTMEIEYTTAYGGNLDNMLAAEKAGLQKIAAAWGLNITFDLPEPSRRGGKAIYGAMNNSAGIVLDTWVEGIAAGPSIYIIRMSTDPGPAFQNYTQYGYVLVDSIVFHLPAASLAGAWTSTVRQDSYKGQAVAFRNYDVLLNLGSSGSYTYTVQQSLPPSWELRVSGNWAVSNAAPANSQVSVQIKLTPVSIQWQPSAGLDTTTELARLRYEGYPGISEEMFGASTDINGSLYLQRLTDNALTNYKPSTAPAPATITITDAASFSVAPVAQGSLISLFGTFGVTQSAASSLAAALDAIESLSNCGRTSGRGPVCQSQSSQRAGAIRSSGRKRPHSGLRPRRGDCYRSCHGGAVRAEDLCLRHRPRRGRQPGLFAQRRREPGEVRVVRDCLHHGTGRIPYCCPFGGRCAVVTSGVHCGSDRGHDRRQAGNRVLFGRRARLCRGRPSQRFGSERLVQRRLSPDNRDRRRRVQCAEGLGHSVSHTTSTERFSRAQTPLTAKHAIRPR